MFGAGVQSQPQELHFHILQQSFIFAEDEEASVILGHEFIEGSHYRVVVLQHLRVASAGTLYPQGTPHWSQELCVRPRAVVFCSKTQRKLI